MRDVLPEALSACSDGGAVALATVVETWQSAPRPAGATMLVTSDDTAVGSLSGGCVEGDVYEVCRQVLTTGKPVLRRYGVSDDDALAVGLTCGGILDVFIERVHHDDFAGLDVFADDVARHAPVALATVVDHPDPAWHGRHMVVRPNADPIGGLGSPRVDTAVREDALGLLASGESRTLHYGPDGQRIGDGLRVFVESCAPPPRLLVFGATDFAAALARAGTFLGHHVTVCDARPVFATTARFPGAEVVVDWPHRYLAAEAEAGRLDTRTSLAVLTHHARFDVPLLELALRLPVGYIGAMGSRRTHDERLRRLRERGLSEHELAKLSSPIGLDIGAHTPEETAISIVAEMIQHRWGGTGMPLAERQGPIHHT